MPVCSAIAMSSNVVMSLLEKGAQECTSKAHENFYKNISINCSVNMVCINWIAI